MAKLHNCDLIEYAELEASLESMENSMDNSPLPVTNNTDLDSNNNTNYDDGLNARSLTQEHLPKIQGDNHNNELVLNDLSDIGPETSSRPDLADVMCPRTVKKRASPKCSSKAKIVLPKIIRLRTMPKVTKPF